jgi:hypothetical protein
MNDVAVKLRIWQKAKIIPGVDSSIWRKDECNAWIFFDGYGNRTSDFGWEIDHIRPVSKGGSNELGNLRPLQWENNAAKQDERLVCVITSSGNKNIRK